MSLVTPERQVAFDVLRRTFEREEHTEVAFREEAAARELTGRNRAQAQRLSYGAVQRRGTSDWVISSFMKQKSRRPDPAVAAALRLGIFELLFSDGTPITPPSIRRSAWSGRRGPTTQPGSPTPCCVAPCANATP